MICKTVTEQNEKDRDEALDKTSALLKERMVLKREPSHTPPVLRRHNTQRRPQFGGFWTHTVYQGVLFIGFYWRLGVQAITAQQGIASATAPVGGGPAHQQGCRWRLMRIRTTR